MSGDYLFPKKKLRSTGDVLDPSELNQSILPAAERLNGQLNQHNVKAPIPNSVDIVSGAYTAPYSTFTYAASGLSNASAPSSNDASIFTLYGESSWRVVTDATVSLTTGTSMLMMWASAWFCYQFIDSEVTFEGDGTGSSASRWAYSHDRPTTSTGEVKRYRAAIQFALRIDGTVIPETITGRVDTEQAPFYPYRVFGARMREDVDADYTTTADSWPAAPVAGNAPVPDSRSATAIKVGGRVGPQPRRLLRTPHGVNYTCFPIRIGYNILVEPGGHTVELVARRIANRHEQTTFISKVNVYSRQLVVLDSPLEPVGADRSLTSPVTVPEFQPEDTLSATTLETDRITPIEASANAIEVAQVARGALNSDHVGTRKTILQSVRQVAGGMESTGSLVPNTIRNRDKAIRIRSNNYETWGGFSTLTPAHNLGDRYDSLLGAVTVGAVSRPVMIVSAAGMTTISKTTTLFKTSSDKMLLMVLANVELRYLAAPNLQDTYTTGGAGGTFGTISSLYHAQAFAGFGIAIRFLGDSEDFYYLYRPSEAIINSANYYDGDESNNVDMRNVSTTPTPSPGATGTIKNHGNVHAEISMMAFFDLSDSRVGKSDIADVAVIGGVEGATKTILGSPVGDIEARVNRASIFAFAIDAGGS